MEQPPAPETHVWFSPCGYRFTTSYNVPIPPEALKAAAIIEKRNATRLANRNRLLPVREVLSELVADAKPQATKRRKPQRAAGCQRRA
ncbi:MAG: hypothetical protein KF723_21435 [Rhizobiaceae bacterium]|nr:hypothetical protein [Rhizobiaceae bacterium]